MTIGVRVPAILGQDRGRNGPSGRLGTAIASRLTFLQALVRQCDAAVGEWALDIPPSYLARRTGRCTSRPTPASSSSRCDARPGGPKAGEISGLTGFTSFYLSTRFRQTTLRLDDPEADDSQAIAFLGSAPVRLLLRVHHESMIKLFTPLSVGTLELSHRVVLECALTPGAYLRGEYSGLGILESVCEGTLVIIFPISEDIQREKIDMRRSLDVASAIVMWKEVVDRLHRAGQFVVMRLEGSCVSCAEDAQLLAKRTLDTGFDGIELEGAGSNICDILARRNTQHLTDDPDEELRAALSSLTDAIGGLAAHWTSERLGVRLAPFAARGDDTNALLAFEETLEVFSAYEIAYVHLSGTTVGGASQEGIVFPSPAARLRRAFPNVLVASGSFGFDSAVAAVESRWADAICLNLDHSIDHEISTQITQLIRP